MAKFIQNGKTIDHTASSAGVSAGECVQIGSDFYGVADRKIPANAQGCLTIDGVYAFPASANVTRGGAVYAGADGTVVASEGSGTSGTKIGRALETVSSGGTVNVLLNA